VVKNFFSDSLFHIYQNFWELRSSGVWSVAEAEFCRRLSQWCSDYCTLHCRAGCTKLTV